MGFILSFIVFYIHSIYVYFFLHINESIFFLISGARRDADGYFWITGRIDDMLNVSGHLMSTAEVENILTEHSSVTEAAAVSKPHPIKGQCLYCFITPNEGVKFDKKLQDELKNKGNYKYIIKYINIKYININKYMI